MSLAPLTQPWNDIPVLGPIGISVTNLTTVASQVLGFDAVRHGVYFYNPGSKSKRVAPVGAALAGGSGGILIYPQSEFVLLQSDEGAEYNVNCAWNAVTDDNTDASLTILNFTDANASVTNPPLPTMRQSQRIPVSSPTDTPATVGTVSSLILTADISRRGVIFHNPGSVNIAVSPANLPAVIGAGSIIIPPGFQKQVIGNRRIKINCGWNAIAATGATNPLTSLGLYG